MDTREVVDYVGGISDIENGVIKAVGNPAERFDEDPLRILRAVRFAGRMGSDLDPETKQAILNDNTLSEVSPERIRDEFIKGISSAKDGAHFLGLTQELGLFDQIFPGLTVNISPQTTKDHVVQVAVLLSGNDDSAISSVLKKMKYTRNEIGIIQLLQRIVGLSKNSAPAIKKAFNRFDTPPAMQLEEFARLTGILSPKAVQGFLKFAAAPSAANPKDLMAQGLKGQDIGRAMDDAEMEAYGALVGEVRMLVRGILEAGR
jgi:tRNA nucleotidyltransferase/poly(A) polymerase